MAEAEERSELSDQAAEIARELVAKRFPGTGPRTVAEMEEALTEVKRELGERLQRLWIEQQSEDDQNRTECAACTGSARFYGWRARRVVTCHGEVCFRRRYYHCARCHAGFAPLDRRVGLDGHGTTPTVRAWLADLSSGSTFAQTAARLATFTAVQISESTAARTAVAVGERLRQEELAEAEQILGGTAIPRRTRWQPHRL